MTKRLALLALICLSCGSSKRSVIVVSLSYDATVMNPEAIKNLQVTVEGVGFVTNSIVRVDDLPMPTTFVDIRTLKARVPASAVARAAPHRFNYPGPEQHPGIYGDRTVKITVYNGPPDGGTSNSVSLRVFAKWLAEEKKLGK